MAEKTKLKWLRKEFSSSEELEYYLSQLKHQDKLKSDIISLLQRFQHLLFTSYEPDFLTITYNGEWDVSFGASASEEPKRNVPAQSGMIARTKMERPTKSAGKAKKAKPQKLEPLARVDLKTLLESELLAVGARLRHKTQPSVVATVTRDGHLKIGKNEYQSLSGAATSYASSGRRDGWHCWLFQDKDGDWKPIDMLRERWREEKAGAI